MYTPILGYDNEIVSLYLAEQDCYIPIDIGNRHYQQALDEIIAEGSDCFEGDIPADLQSAADAKQFNQQKNDYVTAKARLAQYEVANGRAEVTEDVVVGQEWDEESEAFVDVTETVVTLKAIDPVEATVTVVVPNAEDPMLPSTEETIENPLITTDKEERASAQAVVDATPQAVKDAVD